MAKWNRLTRERGVEKDVLNVQDLVDFLRDVKDAGIADKGTQVVIEGNNLSVTLTEVVPEVMAPTTPTVKA